MINPSNPPILVVFGGKTYNCDLTLGALVQVEGELNIGIVLADGNSLWTRPEFYKRAVLLYALLRSTPLRGVTLERCSAEVTGPNAERLLAAIQEAVKRVQPQIERLSGLEPQPADPTLAPSSGEDSGQPGD